MSSTTPGLRAYEVSIRSDIAELVGQLRELLGAQLVAYLGSVSETRAVRQWAEGTRKPPAEAIRRMRLAYQVAGMLTERDHPRVVQAWFQGMNPQLEDIAPARLIREGNPDEVGPRVLAAARAFGAAG
ncbi:hypothetical protein D6T64_01270 [Cryobacterium melibiosiphilum]|uniref:Uncharacterized protein n=1 Tax=Cryobacterium melibiosiphilum TaxID=995039 RepID=A0A3A5MR13_9MICO|nr:hypothetical protein D6T64_01270 [Cryobacterium melibiosiphilum]